MANRPLPKPLCSGSFDKTAVQRVMDATYVYRAYCRCGDLLYVGVTGDVFYRMAGHRQDRADWELKFTRLEWDVYRTREQALRVEGHLIRTLGPLHNKQGTIYHPRPQPLPWPRAFTEDELHECAVAAYRGVEYLAWVWGKAAAA